jgi:hypothetical protein
MDGSPDTATTRPEDRPLRILVSLFHPGYLRHYGEPVRLLAARGHRIHLTLGRAVKDAGDDLLLTRLLEDCPTVTAGPAPRRGTVDGWRRIAWFVRATMDFARYTDPRFADAHALRERGEERVRERLASHKLDPASRWLLTRLVERVGSRVDARHSRTWIGRLSLVEEAIPPSRRITRFVREQQPDAVLATPVVEFGSSQVEFLKSARELGIPIGVCIASWDNLTNKGLLRILPDRVIVWNTAQVEELEQLHGVPAERAVITGAQRYDEWFERTTTRDRDAFARRVGLVPGLPFFLYVCSSSFIAPHEVPFVRRWLGALRASSDERMREAGVVVRPHPQNGGQWAGVDFSDLGNVTIWPREGRMPDAGDDRADYFDALSHCTAVVGINTSALVEAAVVGAGTYTVLDPDFAGTQEGTLHFHHLLAENGGVLRVAGDLGEHVEQLARSLEESPEDARRAREFVSWFVRPHGLDVPAAPLVAAAIEELAGVRPAPAPRHASRFLLRPPLSLAAALTTVVATAAFLVDRGRYRLLGRARVGDTAVDAPIAR